MCREATIREIPCGKMAVQTVKRSRIFPDRLCIVTPAATNVAMTSQVLTNLVFLARRKDQPLDKSVFIRKEEKPSSIYQPCPGHYSLSFSPKPAFLSPNIRHLSRVGFFDRSGGVSKLEVHADSSSWWLIKRAKSVLPFLPFSARKYEKLCDISNWHWQNNRIVVLKNL